MWVVRFSCSPRLSCLFVEIGYISILKAFTLDFGLSGVGWGAWLYGISFIDPSTFMLNEYIQHSEFL